MYDGLEMLKESGLRILKIDDRFVFPTNFVYRDISVFFIDFSTLHIMEIQLTTQLILEAKNFNGHLVFDEFRKIEWLSKSEFRYIKPPEVDKVGKPTLKCIRLYKNALKQ